MARDGITIDAREVDKYTVRLAQQLKPGKVRQAARAGSTKAWRPVAKTVKSNLKSSRQSKSLWRSIGVKTKTYSRSGAVAVVVGPRVKGAELVGVDTDEFQQDVLGFDESRTEKRNPRNYAHLVERGVQPHTYTITKGNGVKIRINHPGSPAQPFLRPSFVKHRGSAPGVAGKEFSKHIIRFAREAKV